MFSLLIELLKQNPDSYELREEDLECVVWAMEAGMGAFLYHVINKPALRDLSPKLCDELKACYFSAIFSVQDQSAALLSLLKARSLSRFEVCVLKGMSVSYQYYNDPHLRLMRDIDILLEVKCVAECESILFQQGYCQLSSSPPSFYVNHHHTMPFYHEKKNVWIEVHTQLFRDGGWRADIPAFSLSNIRQEMLVFEFEGEEIKRLSAELQIVYIAAHWVEDCKPQGGLFAIWDTVYLLRNEAAFDWDKVLAWVEEARSLAMPLYMLLNNIQRFHLYEIDSQHMKRLRKLCIGSVKLRCFVFNYIIDHFYLQRGHYGKLLNAFSLDVMWSEAAKPSYMPYAIRVAWKLIFPENVDERYSVAWHVRRFRKLLGLGYVAK